jgi:hypothetical protein
MSGGCPFCGPDNTPWSIGDGAHPNEIGQAHLARKWSIAYEKMLGPSCAAHDGGIKDGAVPDAGPGRHPSAPRNECVGGFGLYRVIAGDQPYEDVGINREHGVFASLRERPL